MPVVVEQKVVVVTVAQPAAVVVATSPAAAPTLPAAPPPALHVEPSGGVAVVVEEVASPVATIGLPGPIGPEGPAGPQGPPGAGGGGASFEGTAAESINTLRAIYAEADDAGQLRVWRADVVANAGKLAGISGNAANAGQPVVVYAGGKLTSPGAGLVPEASYFVQADGSLGTSPPSSGIFQRVGVALSASDLLVELAPPVLL